MRRMVSSEMHAGGFVQACCEHDLRATGWCVRATRFSLQVALGVVRCLLSVARLMSALHVLCCMLCCLTHAACRMLPVACCLLHVAFGVVRCLLSVACCLMPDACCTPYFCLWRVTRRPLHALYCMVNAALDPSRGSNGMAAYRACCAAVHAYLVRRMLRVASRVPCTPCTFWSDAAVHNGATAQTAGSPSAWVQAGVCRKDGEGQNKVHWT